MEHPNRLGDSDDPAELRRPEDGARTGVRAVQDTLTSEPIASYFTPRRSDTSSLRYSDGTACAHAYRHRPYMSPSFLAVMPQRETRMASLHLGAPFWALLTHSWLGSAG